MAKALMIDNPVKMWYLGLVKNTGESVPFECKSKPKSNQYPQYAHVWGPFASKDKAMKFGAEHYPPVAEKPRELSDKEAMDMAWPSSFPESNPRRRPYEMISQKRPLATATYPTYPFETTPQPTHRRRKVSAEERKLFKEWLSPEEEALLRQIPEQNPKVPKKHMMVGDRVYFNDDRGVQWDGTVASLGRYNLEVKVEKTNQTVWILKEHVRKVERTGKMDQWAIVSAQDGDECEVGFRTREEAYKRAEEYMNEVDVCKIHEQNPSVICPGCGGKAKFNQILGQIVCGRCKRQYPAGDSVGIPTVIGEQNPMPDSFFRQLSPIEEAPFRKWARENAVPEHFAKAELYHPAVRDEWTKMGVDWMDRTEQNPRYAARRRRMSERPLHSHFRETRERFLTPEELRLRRRVAPMEYNPWQPGDSVRIGDKIKILNRDGQYGKWTGRLWTVTHIAHSRAEHMGYDEGVGGALVSCQGLPVSLYEWEFEVVQ